MKHDNNQPLAYLPALWDVADAVAIQALAAGTATPEQQRRALDWIVLRASNTDDFEYRSDTRDHAFASGRRFVGLQIRKIIGLNLAVFRKSKGEN